jgi:colanic acid/amylovoran biosynthesis protein
MFIELRGVEFVNKGAELMLHAIIQHLENNIDHVQFVMETSHRSPKEKLAELGVWQKAKFQKKGLKLTPLLSLVPKRALRNRNMVLDSEVHAVLDASGFAYGDKWGAKKAAQRSGDFINTWKRQGKKVIFLPQAFGPFTSSDIQSQMRTIIQNSDLIFARDKQSLAYLNTLNQSANNIKLAPDFTNLISVDTESLIEEFGQKTVIIPNQKMLETEDNEINDNYLSFLSESVKQLQEKDELPVFLIHESKKDGALAEQINATLKVSIPIIREENPLQVKGIIGASKSVITSRFHGLVSALSQAKPCLSTGWSHKYVELMKDYDYEEGMCMVSLDSGYIHEKLNLILDPQKRSITEKNLQLNSQIQKERSKEMWSQVIGLLNS